MNPFFLQGGILTLTSRCNNRCLICQDDTDDFRIHKKPDEIDNELNALLERGHRKISIYGGEPFLNRHLMHVLQRLKEEKISISLFTNCRIFCLPGFLEPMRNQDIEVITTLFSHDPAIHDMITDSKKSHEQAIIGIRNLVLEKIPVDVTIVLTSANCKDIGKTIGVIASLNARSIKISGLIYQGRITKNHCLIPDISAARQAILDAAKSAKENDISVSFEKLPFCIRPSEMRYNYEPNHEGKLVASDANGKKLCANCTHNESCYHL